MISQSGGGLGHGDLNDRFVPSLVLSLKDHEDIIQVAAGVYHSMALGATGMIYVWGKGEMGVLGTGSNRNALLPIENPYITKVLEQGIKPIKIGASNYYNAVLLDNGKILVWG